MIKTGILHPHNNNPLAWMVIWAFAAVLLVLFIPTSFRQFLMFLYTSNAMSGHTHTHTKNRTSWKLLLSLWHFIEERGQKQTEWRLPVCHSWPKRKFEIKMVTWVWQRAIDSSRFGVSHGNTLRGRGVYCCWSYASRPIQGTRLLSGLKGNRGKLFSLFCGERHSSTVDIQSLTAP